MGLSNQKSANKKSKTEAEEKAEQIENVKKIFDNLFLNVWDPNKTYKPGDEV